MVVGPLVSAASAGPGGIGIGRAIAGVGAVAMIVLQNKIIADWFHGRHFMLAISVWEALRDAAANARDGRVRMDAPGTAENVLKALKTGAHP